MLQSLASSAKSKLRLSPEAAYQQLLSQQLLLPDVQQASVVCQLQKIYQRLQRQRSMIGRVVYYLLRCCGLGRKNYVRGMYLWGPVGCGKSMLLDLLHHSLSQQLSRRYHLHDFMRWLHQQLHQHQGREDPIPYIFKRQLKTLRLLLLDEFVVEDSADAMLMHRVLQALWQQGICLITSSNTAPSNLYAGGMYRERFLPAIHHLLQHHVVMAMQSTQDYRTLQAKPMRERYLYPCNPANHQLLQIAFEQMADQEQVEQNIQVLGRDIGVYRIAQDTVWFDFFSICSVPRCAKDYLQLVQRYTTWLISGVPQFTAADDVVALNFIHLIDVLYDQKVALYIMADVPLDELYRGKRYAAMFQRTSSRLTQMTQHTWPQ